MLKNGHLGFSIWLTCKNIYRHILTSKTRGWQFLWLNPYFQTQGIQIHRQKYAKQRPSWIFNMAGMQMSIPPYLDF